jgi:hypothetical protein
LKGGAAVIESRRRLTMTSLFQCTRALHPFCHLHFLVSPPPPPPRHLLRDIFA